MYMRRSITVFPSLTKEQVASINETRKQYAKAFNMAVDCLITNNSTSKRFLHKEQYEKVIEACPTLPTGLIQCARDVAVESVKSYNTKLTQAEGRGKKGRRKIKTPKRPGMKDKCTMRYDVRTSTLRGNQLTFSTCNKRIKTIINIPSFFNDRYPKEEGWVFKGANIGIDRKNRVFVNLIFECKEEIAIKENGKTVGIDRGVYNICTTSEGDNYGAKDVRRVKRKYSYVRRELQKKGTRSSKRRLRAISGREERFVRDQNHCISKRLANAEDVAVYVLEDLNSINVLKEKGSSNKTMRRWLSNWSYADLEFKIEYKCRKNGIRVEYVDARYTSQKCFFCKTINKSSRQKNWYRCKACGAKIMADYNAALNIRDNYITQVMKQSEQGSVNAPYGWNATSQLVTELMD